MTNEPLIDPLWDALSELTSATPRPSHERRVRRRCHELLADRRASRPASALPFGVADMMSAAAVAIYVVAVVTQAVRLLGAS